MSILCPDLLFVNELVQVPELVPYQRWSGQMYQILDENGRVIERRSPTYDECMRKMQQTMVKAIRKVRDEESPTLRAFRREIFQ